MCEGEIVAAALAVLYLASFHSWCEMSFADTSVPCPLSHSGCSLKRSGQDYCFTAGRCLSAGRQMTVFHQLDIGVEADVLSVSSCSVSPTQEPGRSASGSSVAGLEDGGRKALRQP